MVFLALWECLLLPRARSPVWHPSGNWQSQVNKSCTNEPSLTIQMRWEVKKKNVEEKRSIQRNPPGGEIRGLVKPRDAQFRRSHLTALKMSAPKSEPVEGCSAFFLTPGRSIYPLRHSKQLRMRYDSRPVGLLRFTYLTFNRHMPGILTEPPGICRTFEISEQRWTHPKEARSKSCSSPPPLGVRIWGDSYLLLNVSVRPRWCYTGSAY
jgi:hypothetical protein